MQIRFFPQIISNNICTYQETQLSLLNQKIYLAKYRNIIYLFWLQTHVFLNEIPQFCTWAHLAIVWDYKNLIGFEHRILKEIAS